MRKESRNRDRFKKKNYPLQPYSISGHEYAKITGKNNDKNVINGPPMIISSTPPGAYAYKDEAWTATYGASMDSYLTLFPGDRVFLNNQSSKSKIKGGVNFTDALAYADNMSLYKTVLEQQQIQFLVSEETVLAAQELGKVTAFQNVRSIGVRGPIHMGGWGKTIGLRATDPEPQSKRKNDDEHILDAGSWRYGPVDLRWDDDRKIWRGFNDLIADAPDGDLNHGTLVFSTNRDLACGFPYLKGKLEDVWWVRKTIDEVNIVGDINDRDKSGKVLTHLQHSWFDKKTNCYAPMNSIFTIHREKGASVVCGSETTFSSPAIELFHDVFFHHRLCEKKDGPINFVCDDVEDCEITGTMKFDGGVWSPAVKIDVCTSCMGGSQFGVTYKNDIALAKKICEVCQLVLKLHGFAKGAPKPGEMAKAADKAEKAAESAGEAAAAFDDVANTGNAALDSAKDIAQLAYEASQLAQETSEAAQNQAANDQTASNDASATETAAIEASDARAAEFNDALDSGASDSAVNRARDALAEADAEAQAATDARRTAEQTAKDSQEASDEAREYADNVGEDAKGAHEDWKEEKAKSGDELTPEEKAADQAAEQADLDAEEAAQAAKDANDGVESVEDCCKKNSTAIEDLKISLGGDEGIAVLDGGNVVTPEELASAINAVEEKVADAIAAVLNSVGQALNETVEEINIALVEFLGESTITAATIASAGTELAKNAVPERGDGDGGGRTDPPPPVIPADPDGDGPGSTTPPPGGEEPAGGGGQPVTSSPPVEAPPPPDCGVISLTDPCSSKTTIISCEGAGDTDGDGGPDNPTTPEGEPTSGDPGTGDGSPGLHGDPSGGTGLGLGSTGGGWLF